MKKLLTFILLFGLVFALYAQEDLTVKYHNVLNVKNIPANSKDLTSFSFLDLGSWFGFALPSEETPEYKGAFPGPYLVSEGRWLGKAFIKLYMKDVKSGTVYNLSNAKVMDISYYPGILTQKYLIDNIYVELNLIFISNRTAVVRAQLYCLDNEEHVVQLSWGGNVFEDVAKLAAVNDEIQVNLGKTDRKLFLYGDSGIAKKTTAGTYNYNITFENELKLEKTRYASAYLFVSQIQNETEKESQKAIVKDFLGYPKKYFDFNKTRWNNYLSKVLKTNEGWGDEREYKQAAVKCLLTLISNWKSPLGALRHDGIVPSYSHSYFTGFWAWDSWKHASALANFEPELAKNQMRAMFDFQNAKGMVPDCVFTDSTNNNWLDTKPPLAGWAVWNIYESTKDKSFLNEFYPKLVKYHKWWYAERDHDKNGLCEYGSTKDSLIAALWESGMDNAIRYDDVKLLRNNENAYSMNQESVDLNAYLYAEKIYLSKIAEVLGLQSDTDNFLKESGELKNKIQETFFDKKRGYFFDVKIDKKRLIDVYGPEGWIPLWAMAASQVEADAVYKVMLNSDQFYTRIPFPTVSVDNPKLDVKGYWRGPVWLDQSYFAIAGLRNYGYVRDARRLTEKTFDRLEGFIKSDKPIRENYNPFTGEGLQANNFSWSAAHLLLLWWGK